MNDHPHDPTKLALAALRYWAKSAAEPSAVASVAPDDLVRQTAWLTVGKAAPSDGTWPTVAFTEPLASVFSRIRHAGEKPPTAWLRPVSLQLQQAVLFPTLDPPALQEADAARSQLGTALHELDQRDLPAEARLEGTLYALQRHAWALPSPLAAVALYDFARTHAALTAALATAPDGEVCLVGGDLSGVQDFLYTLSAEGATKQLRGRSFYLQLLTDACAHAVLHVAGMPLCNLLYAGGGRFYVVLPGAAHAEQLPRLRQELGRKLLDAHHGALYLALGSVPFSPAAYEQTTWEQLNENLEQDKRRRFATLTPKDFADLFKPHQPEPPPEATDEAEPLGPLDQSLEDLGQGLSRATVLSVEPVKARGSVREQQPWGNVLASLGLRVKLFNTEPVRAGTYRRQLFLADAEGQHLPPPGEIVGTRYTVTEAPLANANDVAAYTALGLDTDPEQPLRAGNIKPFNLLAAQSQGVKRLGVLRMDVDDLGELFGKRLDRTAGVAALTYTAALSGALSRFFEGWVGELCRTANQTGQGGVYAVYGGGDDLFIVGSWHRMPGLARQIRDDFAAYVLGRPLQPGERPPISLSAGLTLHGAGYPLYQAAEEAAEALNAAKALTRNGGHHKDAITFLGHALGWAHFAEAEKLCGELVALVLEQGAPRGLLMTIQNLAAQAHGTHRRSRDGTLQFAYGPWIWQGAYQLTRMAERTTGATRTEIELLRERLLGTAGVRQGFIRQAGLAARWAQLLIRDHRNHEEEEER